MPIINNTKITLPPPIHIVSEQAYKNAISKFRENISVDSPWTNEQIVKAIQVHSEKIKTCSALSIATQNPSNNFSSQTVFAHITPRKICNLLGFHDIEKNICNKIKGDNILGAVLLGSKKGRDSSEELFSLFKAFLDWRGIPYSKFESLPADFSDADLAYDGIENRWIMHLQRNTPNGSFDINNNYTNFFDDIKIANGVNINFNI